MFLFLPFKVYFPWHSFGFNCLSTSSYLRIKWVTSNGCLKVCVVYWESWFFVPQFLVQFWVSQVLPFVQSTLTLLQIAWLGLATALVSVTSLCLLPFLIHSLAFSNQVELSLLYCCGSHSLSSIIHFLYNWVHWFLFKIQFPGCSIFIHSKLSLLRKLNAVCFVLLLLFLAFVYVNSQRFVACCLILLMVDAVY